MHWRVGLDIGGTFTDVIAANDASGEVRAAKVPSRKDDPVEGLLAGIGAVGLQWDEVAELTHGTTMVTNDIVEGLNDTVALVSTKGFSDVIAIGRTKRRSIYHLNALSKLPPLVPEHLRFEVDERMDRNGNVVTALSEREISRVVAQVKASGVQAVAVCLIHGYRNPAHEIALSKALGDVVDHVCLSSVISPEIREYERTNTTVLSASVTGRVHRYLRRIDELKPADSDLNFFHSSGGMSRPKTIGEHPLLLALSGPAAGVAATVATIKALGIDSALTFDMGGTTTDTCLINDGQAEISLERELAERRIRLPMVAVHSIGAGGGSIARMDAGALVVGPRSAGAFPGPACYGRGGTDPTVSDANIVLGYLNPARTLGGAVKLDREAAVGAMAPIAEETGRSTEEVAIGILGVAHSNMARALNKVTVERGVDGRECVLTAFGGGGPMHAAFVARQYGIKKVLVPAFSSAYSALGCAAAQMKYSRQRTINMKSVEWDAVELANIVEDLRQTVSVPVAESGHDPVSCRLDYVALVRYSGQSYDVPVPDAEFGDQAALERQFFAIHEALFGFATDEPWELASIRVTISDRADRAVKGQGDCTGPGEPSSRECVFEHGGLLATPVYDRGALVPGEMVDGPALIEDTWSTIVIPPGDQFHADTHGHIHITVGLEQ
ncbi:MAG: hydantoinase/oxoprolinase family protein [Phycisphaeraceae bacterium]